MTTKRKVVRKRTTDRGEKIYTPLKSDVISLINFIDTYIDRLSSIPHCEVDCAFVLKTVRAQFNHLIKANK